MTSALSSAAINFIRNQERVEKTIGMIRSNLNDTHLQRKIAKQESIGRKAQQKLEQRKWRITRQQEKNPESNGFVAIHVGIDTPDGYMTWPEHVSRKEIKSTFRPEDGEFNAIDIQAPDFSEALPEDREREEDSFFEQMMELAPELWREDLEKGYSTLQQKIASQSLLSGRQGYVGETKLAYDELQKASLGTIEYVCGLYFLVRKMQNWIQKLSCCVSQRRQASRRMAPLKIRFQSSTRSNARAHRSPTRRTRAATNASCANNGDSGDPDSSDPPGPRHRLTVSPVHLLLTHTLQGQQNSTFIRSWRTLGSWLLARRWAA